MTEESKLDERTVPFWPDHLLYEAKVAMWFGVVLLIIGVIGLFNPVGLGEPADPMVTPEHTKPEWYFLALFQMLKWLPKTLGAVTPVILILIIEAVFDYLKHTYRANFFIGDSPISGVIGREAFVESGYNPLINRKDLLFLDLDSRKPITLKITDGKILNEIKVSGYLNDFDYIISIPVLKMHMHTGASLSF